jgi:leader peptidase (prepilin peptidase)/N-methyltransferase
VHAELRFSKIALSANFDQATIVSMPLLKIILIFQAAVFGLIIGSFLNVCIFRVPKKLSLWGRSFCPRCATPIPMYRNVPVLTYLFQRGKSACCKNPISLQYPSVEALTGLLSVVTLLHSTSLLEYFLWFLLFLCPLLVISLIDFQLRIIPDVISLPFLVIGVAMNLFLRYPDVWGALKFSGLGILAGGGTLLLLAEIVSRLKKTEAMGGGDIKLSAMLGAFLGWKSLIFIFFTGSVIALAYVILLKILKKEAEDQAIPFGPFLSMGGVLFFLYGRMITDFYFLRSGFPYNPFFN